MEIHAISWTEDRKGNQESMCRWMVAIIAFLLMGATPGQTPGQTPEDIVRWTASGPATANAGALLTVELNAEIEDGWHIYSISQIPGGPTTSVISYPGKQAFRQDGAMKPPLPQTSFDSNFKIETEIYEGKINFKIPLSLEAAVTLGNQKIAIDVLYQACNETTCLPPHTTHLFIPIKILPNASGVSSSEKAVAKGQTGLPVGSQVPDFSFTDFTGKQRKFSELSGKTVLLDFWATWCSPCLADIPKLKIFYERYKSQGFEIIGMDSETIGDDEAPDPVFAKETAERAKQIVKTRGAIWTQATAETAVPIAKNLFGIKSLPAKILIGKDGKIAAVIGEKDDLEKVIATFMTR